MATSVRPRAFAFVPPLAALLACAVSPALSACTADAQSDDGDGLAADLGETDGDTSATSGVALTEPDETAPATALAPAPLDKDQIADLIDLRGLGDSGWSRTHQPTPIAAEYGAALDRFDPSGQAYRGDLTFINWETVVGSSCTQFGNTYQAGRSYAFVSRPDNLAQAHQRGINLIGLSNNHARDCYASPETQATGEVASADMTARSIDGLGDRDWMLSGISSTADVNDHKKARVHTFPLKGRDVRVAFASFYTGRGQCPRAGCRGDAEALFASLRDTPADLRVVAMHSMAAADQAELVRLGQRFVSEFGGDVVFGHGPHVWKPVRVVRKNRGGKGVVFESLGNFLHPALAAQTRNLIGRALFDRTTFELRQVQVLPVANSGSDVRWSSVRGDELASNLTWTPAPRGVYANVAK
jgi:poly-gamma-glutamate synthesis protein (capsule biosynthesis protein)